MYPEPPVEPPPALKQQVTESLRARGVLAAQRTPRLAASLLTSGVAATVLLISGVLIGRRVGAPVQDPRPRFALLLYEDSAFAPSATHDALVAEYSAWADSLRGQGKLVIGEELLQEEAMTLVGSADAAQASAGDVRSDAGILGGLFIVRAASLEHALAIARQCPHLRHGGRVVVRRLA